MLIFCLPRALQMFGIAELFKGSFLQTLMYRSETCVTHSIANLAMKHSNFVSCRREPKHVTAGNARTRHRENQTGRTVNWLKISGVLLALSIVLISGAAFYFSLPDHRYRLTIDVATPDGIKSASSVIAVYGGDVGWGLPETKGLRAHIKGEAAYLDLGSGKNIIALLAHGKSGENSDKMEWLVLGAARAAGQKIEWYQTKSVTGQFPLSGDLVPTLVTMTDPRDPGSVRVVLPGQFESTFGPGYRFVGAHVAVTTDDVTESIQRHISWIGNADAERHFETRLRETGNGAGGSLAWGRNLKRS